MRADRNVLLEFAQPGFLNHDLTRLVISRCCERRGVEIALDPGRNDVSDILGIALLIEQMIGTGERDETFGMLGCNENMGGVVDADRVVGRRM